MVTQPILKGVFELAISQDVTLIAAYSVIVSFERYSFWLYLTEMNFFRPKLKLSIKYFIFIEIRCKAPFPLNPHSFDVTCTEIFQKNFPIHTMCRLRCKPKYVQTSGNHMITCLRDGSWSGSPIECKGKSFFKVKFTR